MFFGFLLVVRETADHADRLPGSRVIRLRYAVILIGCSPIIAVDLPITGRAMVVGPVGAIGGLLPSIGGLPIAPCPFVAPLFGAGGKLRKSLLRTCDATPPAPTNAPSPTVTPG